MKNTNSSHHNLISSKDAATKVGYTNDYISRLCRYGRVEGEKIGNTWFVDEISLRRFVDLQTELQENWSNDLSRRRKDEYHPSPTGFDAQERASDLRRLAGALTMLMLIVTAGISIASATLRDSVPFVAVSESTQSAAGILSGATDFFGTAFSRMGEGVKVAFTSFANSLPFSSRSSDSSTSPVSETAPTSSTTSASVAINNAPTLVQLLVSGFNNTTNALKTAVLGINTSVTIRDNTDIGGSAAISGALRIGGSSAVNGLLQAQGGINTNNADINAGTGKLFASNVVNSITAGTNVRITGTLQNPIISSISFGGGGGGSSSSGVSSITLTVPSILAVSGSPLTSAGTLAISYSGTALPIENGGTGTTTGGVTNGVQYFDGTIFTNSSNLTYDGTKFTTPYASTTATTVSEATWFTGLTPSRCLELDSNGMIIAAGGACGSAGSFSGILPVANGGTGLSSLDDGSLVFGSPSGSTALTALATTTGAGRFLSLDYTTGRPSWVATTTLFGAPSYGSVLAFEGSQWQGVATSSLYKDANISGVTLGLLSNTDWTTFNNKVSFAWPFTTDSHWGQTVSATTTALWLQGSPFSLFASSTAVFSYASSSALTISGASWLNTARLASTLTLAGAGTVSCAGGYALQTNGSGDV